MNKTEGETRWGDGQLGPTPLNQNKLRIADWESRIPSWNSSAACRRVGILIFALIAIGLTYSGLAHSSQHNTDGSHKIVPIQLTLRRSDGSEPDGPCAPRRPPGRTSREDGRWKLASQSNEDLLSREVWLGMVGMRRRPECVGKPEQCGHRRVDGLCRRRWELCQFVPPSAISNDVFPVAVIMASIAELKQMVLWVADDIRRDHEQHGRDLQAVAKKHYAVLKENEELRQLNKEGYFNFAVRVKGEDFLAFATIMALGNRKAAAAHLKIPARTFYSRVSQWAKRGKDYQLMCRYNPADDRAGNDHDRTPGLADEAVLEVEMHLFVAGRERERQRDEVARDDEAPVIFSPVLPDRQVGIGLFRIGRTPEGEHVCLGVGRGGDAVTDRATVAEDELG